METGNEGYIQTFRDGAVKGHAGFWKRFAAAILDGIITGIAGGLIGFALGIILVIAGLKEHHIVQGLANLLGFIL